MPMSRTCSFFRFCPANFFLLVAVVLVSVGASLRADEPSQTKTGEPLSEKARKTWETALDWQKKGFPNIAIDELREANQQDGGHCTECLRRAYELALASGASKDATEVAREWLTAAATNTDKAAIHARLGEALVLQGITYKKKQFFAQGADEYKTALVLDPHRSLTHMGYGVALAQMRQDGAALAEFRAFLDADREYPALHWRAERYIEQIDLAREPLAPEFKLTTMDGKQMSRDGLAGKVVLIDFWASWCAPCRASIPTIANLVKEFDGRPFVVISVNLDKDEDAWKSMVRRYGMTWPEACDGGFNGPTAQMFAVRAIPATFTIDADGILQDQRVGDTNLEAKLKKMVAQAEKIGAGRSASVAETKTLGIGK
jgi:thiol-disulfide isomerase/thioredoxin